MQLAFLQPHMAWLLLAVPLVWFLPWRGRASAQPRAKAQAALRTTVLTLVVLALAQPVVVTPRSGGHRAVVLDLTASVAQGARGPAAAKAASEANEETENSPKPAALGPRMNMFTPRRRKGGKGNK